MLARTISAPLSGSGSTGPFAPCGARTIATSPDADGSVEPARDSASISVMSPVSGTGPGLRTSPITNTRWLRYCSTADRDLRVPEVAVGELLLQLGLELAQRQAAGRDAADQRERERAVGLDGVLAAEIGLVEDLDGQHVLRTDDVVGRCDCAGGAATRREGRRRRRARRRAVIFFMLLRTRRSRSCRRGGRRSCAKPYGRRIARPVATTPKPMRVCALQAVAEVGAVVVRSCRRGRSGATGAGDRPAARSRSGGARR